MGEACRLRLMQADGMNDNLSGNPAMPPPTGTTVQDREGITSRHPYALPAAGMGITDSHPSVCFQQQPISPDSCQGCPGDISVYIKV